MNRVALYARYSSENQRDACIEDQLRQCHERAEREGRAKRPHLTNRPVTLLSGLLTCGCCGGRISMVMSDRYACRNHLRKGICNNARTIRRDEIETRVLAGLKEKLVSSEAVAEAVCAYAKETNRLNRDRRAQADMNQKALQKVDRAITAIMAPIEDGMYQSSMKARMAELERDKAEIAARMAQAPAAVRMSIPTPPMSIVKMSSGSPRL